MAGDTLWARCGPGPLVAPVGTDSISVAVQRLLPADDDLLLVTGQGALLRVEGPNHDPVPVLDGGKDFDLRGGILVRLDRNRASFFRYGGGRLTPVEQPLPVASHELSVALGPRSLYLHSPGNPANVLVVELDRRTGDRTRSFFPIQRDLLRLLMTNADAVLKDAGYVRAFSDGFVYVPMIRDPIEVMGQRAVALFLAGGDRGTIRTVSERVVRDEQVCPTCTQHRELESGQTVRRLYADAIVEGEALWILRLTPPGSASSALHRYPIDSSVSGEIRSWRLGGMESAPRAMAFWRGRLAVADDHHLHFYEIPSVERGMPCSPSSP